jgi:hypothetical protein
MPGGEEKYPKYKLGHNFSNNFSIHFVLRGVSAECQINRSEARR